MPRHHVHHPISPPSPLTSHATRPPTTETMPSVLDAHRRTLFAQRLAVLIRRVRAATAAPPEDSPNDCR